MFENMLECQDFVYELQGRSIVAKLNGTFVTIVDVEKTDIAKVYKVIFTDFDDPTTIKAVYRDCMALITTYIPITW